MEIAIQGAVFQNFPKMAVRGLVATNIQIDKLPNPLAAESFRINQQIDTKELVKQWKGIYKSFPTDKKARCSIEYLVWAFEKERLRNIHPIVDLYNQASLITLAPFGGEDMDILGDSLLLSVAKGAESFTSLGKSEIEYPKEGEIIWGAGDNVVCRSLNWIESDIYKITENSRNIVFVSEQPSDDFPSAEAGIDFLQKALESASDNTQTFVLGAQNSQFVYK